MNNKTLGTLALIGAPFLLAGPWLEEFFKPIAGPWFYGAWAFVYITAWMCSIGALRRMEATGRSRFGRNLLRIILFSLSLANLSNIYALVAPGNKSAALFIILDSFWPISNLIMLVVGITVVAVKGLPGWRRYVPLATGLWFPLTMLTMILVGRNSPLLVFVPWYSAIAWSLLAVAVLTCPEKRAFPATVS
jgi:hypothetical protein